MRADVKKIIAVVVAFLGLSMLTGCSSVSTAADEVALHYKGGPFSSKTFANCVGSASRDIDGPGDKHYVYPRGQRTFSFTGRAGSEIHPIVVTTKDGQNLSVPGFVTFTLKTDCKTLRDFHERVGMKYGAYKGGGPNGRGWNEFLNDYIAVPLTSSMNKASLSTGWYDLYSSSEAQAKFEEYVKDNLPAEVTKALGEDFITINAVQISKPQPSDRLTDALASAEEAKLADKAQKQKNAVARTKYDSMQDCRRSGLSENACLVIYLADSGKIPFYTVPQGSDLNIPTR